MERNETPESTPPIPPNDPYPRMIIVCVVISVVLLLLLFGVLAIDFTLRTHEEVQPVTPLFQEQFPQPSSDQDEPDARRTGLPPVVGAPPLG